MRIFAEKPKANQQGKSPKTAVRTRSHFGHSHEVNSAAVIQTKLAINRPGDAYEQEADRIAEQVMRTPEPKLQRACACGGGCPKCKAEQLSQERERLQTKPVGSSDLGRASQSIPQIVTEVLRSDGQPLDPVVQSLMGTRFGVDFSEVRIHSDATAAQSAAAINARAYTVGRNVVFGANQYQPATSDGRGLLAHELTHVMQQSHAPDIPLQRACRSAAQCVAAATGDAAQFGATVEAESEQIAIASGGAPAAPGEHASCHLPRHGERATHLEALATGAGLGASIAPGIDGYFINACLSPNDGANNSLCSEFPGGPPAGTAPGHRCVQIHTTDEDQAAALLAKPRPLGDADLRQFLWITALVAHESQHIRFNTSAGTIVPPAPDCNVNTPVPIAGGAPVETLLSEISAEIAEFDVYFRNLRAHPSRSSVFALQSEEHDLASRGSENILGNIRDLQCACSCSTVDTFVEQVFNQASSGWSAAEKREFRAAMTAFIPSFWPRSLHQT